MMGRCVFFVHVTGFDSVVLIFDPAQYTCNSFDLFLRGISGRDVVAGGKWVKTEGRRSPCRRLLARSQSRLEPVLDVRICSASALALPAPEPWHCR